MTKTNVFIILSLIINSIASFAFAMDDSHAVILPQNQLVSLEGVGYTTGDATPKNSVTFLNSNIRDLSAIGFLFFLSLLISFLIYKRAKLEKLKKLKITPALIYYVKHLIEGRRR